MNNSLLCLVLAFSVACSSAQKIENPAVARPERVIELHKIVTELIKLEPQITLVEQDGKKNIEPFAIEMETQLDGLKDRCHADPIPKLRTKDEREWCTQQVIHLCKVVTRLAPLDIEHQFRLRDVYAQWFDAAQPLMRLLADEYQDQRTFTESLEHSRQMTMELARFVDTIMPCEACKSEPRQWMMNLRTFGVIYKKRGDVVQKITAEWRAEAEAIASASCPLLESAFIIQPGLNDIRAMMNELDRPFPR